MQLTSPIVEIRIPTYNRPALLRRALNALMAQTYANWRAVILDDGDSARPIVSELGDDRLVYSPNPVRLGAASNINRAFSRQPMAGGEFFYVLEDDNLIVPMFIEENLRWLSQHDVRIVINNQWVEVPQGDLPAVTPAHDNRTTIDCFTDGVWSADDFKVAMLWRMPISNGSIFWRRDCRSVFTVEDRYGPGLHEWLRAYCIADSIYFNDTPNAFWYPTPEAPPRSFLSGMPVFLMRERTVMAMRRNILAGLRRRGEIERVLSRRYKTPLAIREEGILKALGRWPGISRLSLRRRAELLGKACVLRSIVRPVPLPMDRTEEMHSGTSRGRSGSANPCWINHGCDVEGNN